MLRVDPTDPGPWAVVVGGARGLGLTSTPAPEGLTADAHVVLRPVRGMPFATHEATIANEGAIALTAAPGVARTLRMPDMATLFDRRPPGVSRAVGASGANAGLLRDDGGWRAVVLPSMGDLVADLGAGPVAVRADGRRVAVSREGGVVEMDLPGGAATPTRAEPATGLAYTHDGTLLIAVGDAIGPVASGSPITSLSTAHAAPVAVSCHQDGQIRIWDTTSGNVSATWAAPAGLRRAALNADGTLVSLGYLDGDTPVAAIARATDGARIRRVIGAHVIAFDPADRGLLVGGEWGALWMEPPREAS
jgi:hypothetical protein